MSSFRVIWNNWYGRKQERTLCFLLNCYQRKLEAEVRATHAYGEVDRVEWSADGSFCIHLNDGTAEHYISTQQVALIANTFQRHCKVIQLT